MSSSLEMVRDASQAATILHPTRLQLLQAFRSPRSAAEAARLLGLPRQRVGYHVRELEGQGFLRQTGERRRGNFVERLLEASAAAYLIAPQALGPVAVDPEEVQDRFSSTYLVAVAARTLRDLATLRDRAGAAGKKLPTLTLQTEVRFRGPREQSAFAEELAGCLADLIAKYHDDDAPRGRRFRFAVCGYPAPAGAAEEKEHRDDATDDVAN